MTRVEVVGVLGRRSHQGLTRTIKSEHIGKIPKKPRSAKGRGGGDKKNSLKPVDAVRRWRLKEVTKGVWGMPWLSEAKKDVISCDKLRGSANRN